MRHPQPNPLQTAIDHLTDTIDELCQPRYTDGHRTASRYAQLRAAIDITASRAGTGTGTNRSPCWLDALKLAMTIDERATKIHTARRHAWRPQDIPDIGKLTTEISAWCKAIDDLFTAKPIYLPHPCPHCGQTQTHRWNDEGERTWTPALALTVDHAWCQACHDRWSPDQFGLLARQLGMPELHECYSLVLV
jgi:hypothetical protein